MPASDGKRLMHAHLTIHGASLMLCDDFPEHRGGKKTPPALRRDACTCRSRTPTKRSARRWTQAPTVAMPLGDMFWGDRYGQVDRPVRAPLGDRLAALQERSKGGCKPNAAQSQAQAADAKPATKGGKKKIAAAQNLICARWPVRSIPITQERWRASKRRARRLR